VFYIFTGTRAATVNGGNPPRRSNAVRTTILTSASSVETRGTPFGSPARPSLRYRARVIPSAGTRKRAVYFVPRRTSRTGENSRVPVTKIPNRKADRFGAPSVRRRVFRVVIIIPFVTNAYARYTSTNTNVRERHKANGRV